MDVLTRDGTNRSEAIRQALLEAGVRRERLVEMKRAEAAATAGLTVPMPT